MELKHWVWVGLAAAFVVVLWALSWGLIWWQPSSLIEPGPFGDMFGSVNALFSGLAFSGIILALILQRRDLEMQREVLKLQMEEIRLQREELARSAEAQEAQVKALVIAAQLNGLATFLEHSEILTDMEIEEGSYDGTTARNQVSQIGRLLRELSNWSEQHDTTEPTGRQA